MTQSINIASYFCWLFTILTSNCKLVILDVIDFLGLSKELMLKKECRFMMTKSYKRVYRICISSYSILLYMVCLFTGCFILLSFPR